MASFAVFSTVIAIVIFIVGEFAANGAPQECAVASISLCIGILPYILLKLSYCGKVLENQKRIIELLQKTNGQ